MANRTRRHMLFGVGIAAAAGLGSVGFLKNQSARIKSTNIDIESAELRQINSRWILDCQATIDLPMPIQAGLESGVPLQFIVSVRVTKSGAFWRNNVLLKSNQRFRLVYYELTRHYRVHSVENDSSVNKRSLLSALDELGTLKFLDLTNWVRNADELADSAIEKNASVSIYLDRQYLPLPLQPMFSDGWRLTSEEFVWPLS